MTSNIKPTLALAALALTGLINTASAGAWILDFATPWQITSYSPSAATWTKTFSTVPPPSNAAVPTIYGYYNEVTNTFSPGPEMITATITTTGVYNGGELVNSTSPLTLMGIPKDNPYVTYTLTLSSPVTNLKLYAWDIDSDPTDSTMTDLWGWATPTPDDIEINSQVALAGSIPGYTTYGTISPGENVVNFPTIPWIPEDQLPHTVAASYTTFKEGDFVWGFQGDAHFKMTREHQILGIIAPEPGSAMTAFLTGAAMVGLVNRRKRQS
jgi:hypothetical protein